MDEEVPGRHVAGEQEEVAVQAGDGAAPGIGADVPADGPRAPRPATQPDGFESHAPTGRDADHVQGPRAGAGVDRRRATGDRRAGRGRRGRPGHAERRSHCSERQDPDQPSRHSITPAVSGPAAGHVWRNTIAGTEMLKARAHDGAGCAEEQLDATLREEAEGEGFEPSKSLHP